MFADIHADIFFQLKNPCSLIISPLPAVFVISSNTHPVHSMFTDKTTRPLTCRGFERAFTFLQSESNQKHRIATLIQYDKFKSFSLLHQDIGVLFLPRTHFDCVLLTSFFVYIYFLCREQASLSGRPPHLAKRGNLYGKFR